MTKRSMLRASDADREQVAERLRRAAAEGRLFADELEDRLGAAFSARTYGELDPLVADLPGTARPPGPAPARAPAAPGPVPRGRLPAAPVAALALIAATILLASFGAAVGGHHHWGGPSIIWLVWVAIGLRLLMRRRGRWRS